MNCFYCNQLCRKSGIHQICDNCPGTPAIIKWNYEDYDFVSTSIVLPMFFEINFSDNDSYNAWFLPNSNELFIQFLDFNESPIGIELKVTLTPALLAQIVNRLENLKAFL